MSRISRFLTGKGSAWAYGVVTAIFMFVPEEIFKHGFIPCSWSEPAIVLINRIIVFIVVLVVTNVAYQWERSHRKSVSISGRNYSIKIEYGDLFNIAVGKKVINFDECFSTNVGDKPEDIKPGSVCGQYLSKYPIKDLKSLIRDVGINSIGKSDFKGKERFALGTIIPREDFLLMAFAKLDKNGLGHFSYEEYLKCLSTLWGQIDRYHGTDDVFLPILGSRITRFDNKELTQQELLDIMISSYRLSSKKLRKPNALHIVCKEREDFSLNAIDGVD